MAGLSDLNFDPGIKFASLVLQRFGCSVSPTIAPFPTAFHLVASFGCSAIRLNEDSVGLILQSCLRGSAKNFNVLHLLGWMFSFSVSCKNVGIMIHKLRSFSFKSFAIFFHLWSRGGPNWQKDMNVGVMNKILNGTLLKKGRRKIPWISIPLLESLFLLSKRRRVLMQMLNSLSTRCLSVYFTPEIISWIFALIMISFDFLEKRIFGSRNTFLEKRVHRRPSECLLRPWLALTRCPFQIQIQNPSWAPQLPLDLSPPGLLPLAPLLLTLTWSWSESAPDV